MAEQDSITLRGFTRCQGEITLPGSKSIANRALLMAALCRAGEQTQLSNVLRSDDTARMLAALEHLGVPLSISSDTTSDITVTGLGGAWQLQQQQLDLGNAGTAMRPLLAVLAATLTDTQHVELTGNTRMQERPLQHLTDALQRAGARLEFKGQAGYPPVQIQSGLRGGQVQLDASQSSQYVSALLMALPLLADDSVLCLTGDVVSWPYIELTLTMLARFGIQIEQMNETEFFIAGGQQYRSPGQYWVEGDASSASYWLAAGLLGGGPLRIHGVGSESMQGDVKFAEYLQFGGANLHIAPQYIDVLGGKWRGVSGDFNAIPDAAMTFATLALFAEQPTELRNIANWRLKETDRIAAMATELRKCGAQVMEFTDGIAIQPPPTIEHAIIDTYDDHRMAMCFALLGFSQAGVTIHDPNCCAKTYPDFFSKFQELCK